MTREEALEIIEYTDTNYQQPQRILLGLQILARHDEVLECSFEHDQMWASSFDMTVAKMSRDEVWQMARAGWFEDQDAWSHW